MCGIYATNISINKGEVGHRLKEIEFRGPDNMNVVQIDDLILGHLRLAVIDLDERANQPMSLDHLHIIFNGEIYNFEHIKKELLSLGHRFTTDSDTEVLLHGYKEYGAELPKKLNGMFSFCIYDSVKRELFCARDRLGVKPFYYYWKNGEFEICSQLAPIKENKVISNDAISIYLDCGYIPSPYSIFQNVYKLPPGNTMMINLVNGNFEIREYWNLKKVPITRMSYRTAKSHLHELLIDSVRIRLRSDVPIGSFLSGGIDSAIVSSIAAGIINGKLNTFSIGFNDAKFDESKIAEQYARVIGSNHTTTICNPEDAIGLIPILEKVYDEPFADSSALPSLLLNSVTKKHVTVALSGDGGDESFFGYKHFDSVTRFNFLKRIPASIRGPLSLFLRFIPIKPSMIHLVRILKLKSIDEFIKCIFIGYDSLQEKRNLGWLQNFERYMCLSSIPLQKAADLNIKLWLENDSNVKVDRASMAFSVEVRSPFLDYRIIEFARTLPVSFRYKYGKRKRILRDILKEYIPKELFDQPKKGFSIPIGYWIRNQLKDEFLSNLSDDFLNSLPNLDVSKFKYFWNMHLKGEGDYSPYIWRLYVLSKWYRKFGLYKDKIIDPCLSVN